MSTEGTEDDQRAISIITANTGYITGEGQGERRRRKISELLKTEKPTLVLLQLFGFKHFDVTSHYWRNYNVDSKYAYFYGGDEASFLYDNTKLTLTPIGETNEKKVDKIRDVLRSKNKQLELALGRMPMVLAEHHNNVKFLCVSFHGLYKKDDSRKWLEFEAMLMLVAKLSKELKLPFIIGGGFNLNIRDASDFLKDKKLSVSIVVHAYKALSRRDQSLKRDFFIGSKSFTLEKVRPLDWNEGLAIFYHDPIVATIKVDDFKSMKENIKKEIKEKMERKEIEEIRGNMEEIKKRIKEEIKKEIHEQFENENENAIKEDIIKRTKEGVKKEIKEEIKDEIKEGIEEERREDTDELIKRFKINFEKEIRNQIKEEAKNEIKEEIMKEMRREIIEEIKDNIQKDDKFADEVEKEIKEDIKKDIIKKTKEEIKQNIKDIKETIKKELENKIKKDDMGNKEERAPAHEL